MRICMKQKIITDGKIQFSSGSMKRKECESMDMKDFSKYLKYKSFDETVHHVRRISMERTADSESFMFLKKYIISAGKMSAEPSLT